MRKLALAAALGLSLSAAGPAFGGTIICPACYATGFENPPFILGPLLAPPPAPPPFLGQDGWVGAPPLSPNAAVIVVFSGNQSVQVRGADLVTQKDDINKVTNGYYDAIGSYRKPVNFDVGAAGLPIVRIQANVRIDGPLSPPTEASHPCVFARYAHPVPCNNFFSASVTARAQVVDAKGNQIDTAGIGELAISSDGHVYGYSGDENVPTFLTSAAITLGAWHTLAVDLNFRTRTFSFSVDGNPLPGPSFQFPLPGPFQFPYQFPYKANTNMLLRGSLVVYAAPDNTSATPPLLRGNYVAHQDNFSIETKR